MQRGVGGGGNRTARTEFGQKSAFAGQANSSICIVYRRECPLRHCIIGSGFQGNGPLSHLRNEPFGIEALGDLFAPAEAVKSCRCGHNGVNGRLVNSRQTGCHVAPEFDEVQVGTSLRQEGAAAGRAGGHRGARSQTSQ